MYIVSAFALTRVGLAQPRTRLLDFSLDLSPSPYHQFVALPSCTRTLHDVLSQLPIR